MKAATSTVTTARTIDVVTLVDQCTYAYIQDMNYTHFKNRLRLYRDVLRKEDNTWAKKCMEYKVESSRPRGRPKITWKETVQKHCQAHVN